MTVLEEEFVVDEHQLKQLRQEKQGRVDKARQVVCECTFVCVHLLLVNVVEVVHDSLGQSLKHM